MSNPVPQGTHPVANDDWVVDLAAREGDAAGESDYSAHLKAERATSLDRRAHAAGFAHIDRLAVDGGAFCATRSPQHPTLWQAIGAFALAGLILAGVYGAFLIAWATE